MKITFYKTTSEPNKINKNLTNPLVLEGAIKQESGVIKPTLYIENSNPSGYNYLEINDFGRKYFIKEITQITNNTWQIEASVDVLMSYKDKILNLPCILASTENVAHANKNLVDGTFVTSAEVFTECIKFNEVVSDSSPAFLLTTV